MTTNPTGEEIIAAARELAPIVEASAAETAAARQLPAGLVAQMKQAGVFRMPMPRAWGGPEMSPRQQLEVIEIISRADPSAGWCVMIGSDSGFYSAFLDDDVGRSLYTGLDDVTAGLLQPAGRARRVEGGYRVSGRWAFGSGCTHADVIAAGCAVFDGDGPALNARGLPEWRVMLAPAGSWRVLDTWHTMGLAGSGSHDYEADDLFVPEERTFSFFEAPRRSGPLYAFKGMFLANMAGVPLGLARRAIDVLAAMANEKRVGPEVSLMKDIPRIRVDIARAEMRLGAARAYAYGAADAAWEAVNRGEPPTSEVRLALGLSRVHAMNVAREVAQLMVDTAGTAAIYQGSPLDGLLRDAITMSQHVVLKETMLEALSGLAVEGESPLPFL